jgi:hypothetical protein
VIALPARDGAKMPSFRVVALIRIDPALLMPHRNMSYSCVFKALASAAGKAAL